MTDSNRLVHIVDDVPELDTVERPTLVLALHGFLDAGGAAQRAAHYLEGMSDGPVVATFDADALHDYRARRPVVSFVEDRYESYDAPRLLVRVRKDSAGNPFLIMTGPEPDSLWERFAEAFRSVVDALDVGVVVDMGAVPMAAPHTRELSVTQHANDPELLHRTNHWSGELRVPASAQSLLSIRLGEWGLPMTGFIAHVPHYLADGVYPQAAVSLLEEVELAGSLVVDLSQLREEADSRATEINDQVQDSPELREIVAGLERQYDTFVEAEARGGSLLATDEELPTGDEIGQQFEQFLANLDDSDEDPGPGHEH